MKQIEGQMNLSDFVEPSDFEDYVGKCKYCGWGHDEETCVWSEKNKSNYAYNECHDHDKWMPNACKIPKLCGSCEYANSFVYQVKPEYKAKLGWNGYSSESADDPLEEPNIYCDRDNGSVNRRKPYERFESPNFGHGHWHRQHEWDTCDAWEEEIKRW